MQLQLTRPTGDETDSTDDFIIGMSIATHTPHRGRNVRTKYTDKVFLLQLTRPTGDETVIIYFVGNMDTHCNSHAPQGTKRTAVLNCSCVINCNSHAPQGTKQN